MLNHPQQEKQLAVSRPDEFQIAAQRFSFLGAPGIVHFKGHLQRMIEKIHV
jgi:hypothetical protein